MDKAKSWSIPKRLVWEAYKRVKVNRGAAGVDDQSIEEFEADLKDNLYKLWNRMSSGSYFPPPVKRVQIAKRGGGKRPLGIPTVADRIAQAVVKAYLEPELERYFHPDSYVGGSCRLPAEDRGRDIRYRMPPAQIRTCPMRAFGSHLGWVTAKRWSGHG